MPGFVVPVRDKAIGGHGADGGAAANADFYNTYTWQIFQLFGKSIMDTGLVYLRDATLPTFTANQDSYLGSSLEYKWAKSVAWDDIKVTWYDTVGLGQVVRDWRKRIWNPTNGLQVAGEYKKRSQIDVYTGDGNNVVTWCLVGSWPKIVKYGELTYTESNIRTVEVTIAYDWAYDTYPEGSGSGSGPGSGGPPAPGQGQGWAPNQGQGQGPGGPSREPDINTVISSCGRGEETTERPRETYIPPNQRRDIAPNQRRETGDIGSGGPYSDEYLQDRADYYARRIREYRSRQR